MDLSSPASTTVTSVATVNGQSDLIELQSSSSNHRPAADRPNHHHHHHSEQPSTDSEVEQNDDSSAIENSDGHRAYGSPNAWSTGSGSESPTPTNSVAVKSGKANNIWHGLLCEEQRQLLGTEEESSDRHSSDDDPNDESITVTSSHNNSHHHSAAPPPPPPIDPNDLLYAITDDQRAYYTKQYQVVQKDPVGNVTGPVARVFFEKSRIPVEELRHVWKLCDVTKDGALSEAEFMAAMHLVVLRRNNIPLPLRLPKCLQATRILSEGVHRSDGELVEADLLHLDDDDGDNDGSDGNKVVQAEDNHLERRADLNKSSSVVREGGDEFDHPGGAHETMNSLVDCGPESINSVVEMEPGYYQLHNRQATTHQQQSSSGSSNNNFNQLNHCKISGAASGGNSNNSMQPPMNLPPVAARTIPPPPLQVANPSGGGGGGWTKFNESPVRLSEGPTTTQSSAGSALVSSPGPKPVNFDMQWTVVGADPQILHPVALRLTPQGAEAVVAAAGSAQRDTSSSPQSNNHNNNTNNHFTSKTNTTTTSTTTTTGSVEFRPIQRPQAKKVKQGLGVGALPPPPVGRDSQNMMNMSIDSAVLMRGGVEDWSPDEQQQEDEGEMGGGGEGNEETGGAEAVAEGGRGRESGGGGGPHQKQQPPFPPPRLPAQRHTRSSSLDLNKLLLQPEVPPRESQTTQQQQPKRDYKLESTFADFSQFQESAQSNRSPRSQPPPPVRSSPAVVAIPSTKRTSAFEVYRKPILQQVSPVILDQEKKVAHLEEMLRSLSLTKSVTGGVAAVRGAASNVTAEATVQQLKEQNAVLVNLCLELGNELFALKYKREGVAQRLIGSGSGRPVAVEEGGGGGL